MLPEPAAPEPAPLTAPPAEETQAHQEEPRPRTIAPLWHTFLLIAAIAAYSFWGAQRWHPPALDPLAPVSHNAKQLVHQGIDKQRLIRYALSGGLELIVVAWVWLGLRLRRIPLRSLFGRIPRTLNEITLEVLIAASFWTSSMTILFVLALGWQFGAKAIYHHQEQQAKQQQSQQQSQPGSPATPKPESPEEEQLKLVRELMDLAPANGIEIAAWGALCLIVGFSEEIAFRGYLQSQGIALFHSIPLGVLLSAIVFGFAHGYQGLRGMVLIGAFGAMFSIITRIRRSLFPGIIAHAWHDFLMGLLLALIRFSHMLDKFTPSS